MLRIKVAAIAMKVAVVAPAGTVTDACTVSKVLLLASVTLAPPAGAAWVSVTVQVLIALSPRMPGLQATPEIPKDVPPDLNAEATDAHCWTEPVSVYLKVTGAVVGL